VGGQLSYEVDIESALLRDRVRLGDDVDADIGVGVWRAEVEAMLDVSELLEVLFDLDNGGGGDGWGGCNDIRVGGDFEV